jgi:hypothetical protein
VVIEQKLKVIAGLGAGDAALIAKYGATQKESL